MTQELSPSATETPFEDKLVPEKYLARLRKQAEAVGNMQLASELEEVASKLNTFSATDLVYARGVIYAQEEDDFGEEYPRDLRGKKIGITRLESRNALDKILEEAQSLVAKVAPAEKRFDAVMEKLYEARTAKGLDEDGNPLSNEPEPLVRQAFEFYAAPLKSYAIPVAAQHITPTVSFASATAAPSAVANLFPESTKHILRRTRNSPASAVESEPSAPEGFAARMEVLCLKTNITHAARWQNLQSIAKEMKEHPIAPENKSTNPADTEAWKAFNRLMALNSGSKLTPKQRREGKKYSDQLLHRVQFFAQAFRADAKAHDAIKPALALEEIKPALPLDDYYSALTSIYSRIHIKKGISTDEAWKEVEALYQNIRSQNFEKSSGNGHIKISDINAKLQPVLVGMFEHGSFTPEEGLKTLSNVLDELYDDVRAIDAREGLHARLAEKSPATGELGSTPLTAKWLEMLPSTVVAKPQRGGYFGKHRTAEEFEAYQRRRRNWDKKFALGVGALGILGVPAAYLMRPQLPPHNPNDVYTPEMSATPPERVTELWRDSAPTPIPPYTPPPAERTYYDDLPPLPPYQDTYVDPSTEMVDTPDGRSIPRYIWEIEQRAEINAAEARQERLRREQSLEAEKTANPSEVDKAQPSASGADTPSVAPDPAANTNMPESVPANKISVRSHKGGYRGRFSVKGDSFAEKAQTPTSTTVTFRS